MIDQVVRSVPKKKKHNRIKKKAKDRGRITPQVYEEVSRRSGRLCEWCGNPPKFWLQKAHLQSRAQLGRGDIPWNIADLCGPSDKKGTCHWELDNHRKKYRDWVRQKIAELEQLYDKSVWPE